MITISHTVNVYEKIQPAIANIIEREFSQLDKVMFEYINNARETVNCWTMRFDAIQTLIAEGVLRQDFLPEDLLNDYLHFRSIQDEKVKKVMKEETDIFCCMYRFALLRQLGRVMQEIVLPEERAEKFEKWSNEQGKALEKAYALKMRALIPEHKNVAIPIVLVGLGVLVCVSGYMVDRKVEESTDRGDTSVSASIVLRTVSGLSHITTATGLVLTAAMTSLWRMATGNQAYGSNAYGAVRYAANLAEAFGPLNGAMKKGR